MHGEKKEVEINRVKSGVRSHGEKNMGDVAAKSLVQKGMFDVL